MNELDIKIIDNQSNCIVCGEPEAKGSRFYCPRCGILAKIESEREGMI